MTMINVGDETAESGGLSANAVVMGAGSNLVFALNPGATGSLSANTFQSAGVLCVNRPFRMNRNDVLQKAKMAISHVPVSGPELAGTIKVIRDLDTIATLPFRVPAAGQMPAPVITTTIAAAQSSAVVRDVGKIKRITAAYRDAVGTTSVSGQRDSWLGAGSSQFGYSFELTVAASSNDLGNSLGITLQLVPYDKLANKEAAAFDVPLTWPMGPFSYSGGGYTTSTIGASGNLPEGTVVNFLEILTFQDGTRIAAGAQQSVVIGPSGAIGIWAGYSSDTIETPDGKARISGGRSTLVKLGTHSTWTEIIGNGNSIPIANTFAAGGIATPPASRTFTAISQAELFVTFGNSSMQGASFASRFEFKGFVAGRQVFGTGAVRSGTAYGSWGNSFNYDWNNDYTGLTNASMNFYNAYNNAHLDYQVNPLQGDQYFTAGEPVTIDVNIPPKANATGLLIYVQNFTTINGATTVESSNGVPKQLIYDGPVIQTFKWAGSVINTNATPPATNTTTNYPASTRGEISWDAADPEFISVSENDAVVCEFTSSTTLSNKHCTQVTIPIEFL